VMARLARPASKLASTQFLQRDFGIEIDVNQAYRMMDHLDDAMQLRIQRLAQDAAFGLFNQKVDVLFFDCTTLYFESFDEDALRQKGFSKDRKSAETQVLLALLVTREGLPIGYRLYPGSQWEGHTLERALADLRQIAQIDRLVLVADSALFNRENIRLLEEQKQPYIVAAQLKKLPQDTQKILFDRSSFERLSDDESFIETIYQGQRLIVTYSAKRAKKDAHDRKKAVEKAHKLYHNKTVKSAVKGHHARYLNVQGDGRLELDENRIAQAARWDGLHGVITNMKELSAQEAISHYHGLWQVEETFRLSKHDLSIRPIFHWT
jgi:transposase